MSRWRCLGTTSPPYLEVRGEITIPRSGFEQMNARARLFGAKGIREPAERGGGQLTAARLWRDGEAPTGVHCLLPWGWSRGRCPLLMTAPCEYLAAVGHPDL